MAQTDRRRVGAAQWYRILALTVTAIGSTAIAVVACDRPDRENEQYRPVVTFDTTSARIITATDTFRLSIDIAERDDQRAYGLMERLDLDENAGMVFLYTEQQPADHGFWMWRTRIPLDIAFFDEDGTIVAILAMEPCPHANPGGCPTYPPGVPYHGALEVNQGYFARRGITTGDRIVLDR